MSILIIKHGGFGDFIQYMGGFQAIRAAHSGEKISLLTIPSLQGMARQCPYFDHVFIDSRTNGLQNYLAVAKLLHKKWTRVYDLQNSDRTALYYYLLAPFPKPQWSGFQQFCTFPDKNPQRTTCHTLERIATQLKTAGIASIPPPALDWLIPHAQHTPPPPNPFALLVPGSAPHRPDKRWPAAHYSKLAAHLLKQGITPILIGMQPEAAVNAQIKAENPAVIDATGKTSMADIAALAAGAILAIGNDTGAMHVTAVVGVKSIVLFSKSSNPARCAPRGENVVILQEDNLENLTVQRVIDACGERIHRSIV
jgi:ADP-heptose:LPS heptosyltransferase